MCAIACCCPIIRTRQRKPTTPPMHTATHSPNTHTQDIHLHNSSKRPLRLLAHSEPCQRGQAGQSGRFVGGATISHATDSNPECSRIHLFRVLSICYAKTYTHTHNNTLFLYCYYRYYRTGTDAFSHLHATQFNPAAGQMTNARLRSLDEILFNQICDLVCPPHLSSVLHNQIYSIKSCKHT